MIYHAPSPLCCQTLQVTLAKTLGFSGDSVFMELTQFASNRKNTTSVWLHRVVVAHWKTSPSIASFRKLEEHVPVVDVRVRRAAMWLPWDLTYRDLREVYGFLNVSRDPRRNSFVQHYNK